MAHNVLVLVSHPTLENSRINDALVEAASKVNNVTVRHLDEILSNNGGHYPVAEEQSVIAEHQSIVLQFPWYWYAAPATLKLYLDEILTRGWAYEGGAALEGKKLLCTISTGGPAEAYGPDGNNKYTMDTLLSPLKATANMTRLVWQEPFIVHGVRHISDEQLQEICTEYQEVLLQLTD